MGERSSSRVVWKARKSGQTLAAEVADHAKTLARNYFSLIHSEKDSHMPPLPDPVNPGNIENKFVDDAGSWPGWEGW